MTRIGQGAVGAVRCFKPWAAISSALDEVARKVSAQSLWAGGVVGIETGIKMGKSRRGRAPLKVTRNFLTRCSKA
jgi:hypothetical protein